MGKRDLKSALCDQTGCGSVHGALGWLLDQKTARMRLLDWTLVWSNQTSSSPATSDDGIAVGELPDGWDIGLLWAFGNTMILSSEKLDSDWVL